MLQNFTFSGKNADWLKKKLDFLMPMKLVSEPSLENDAENLTWALSPEVFEYISLDSITDLSLPKTAGSYTNIGSFFKYNIKYNHEYI